MATPRTENTLPEDPAAEPPADDPGFAAWLAGRCGDLLLALRAERGFEDPKALRDAGDRRSHNLLMDSFATWRPGDAVLSEEGVDDPARLTARRVWIVDPLDGTREYGEPDRTDWAVHVALWERDRGLTAGAVALPAQGVVLSTAGETADQAADQTADRTAGETADQTAGAAQPRADAAGTVAGDTAAEDVPLRIVTSRTRPPDFLPGLAHDIGAELVPMGSAGAKVCAVVQGTVDAYIHAGGQYEWDSAAPVAVALATGHFASRLDGSTLEYNRPDPRLPDLVVCRQGVADRLLAALAGLGH